PGRGGDAAPARRRRPPRRRRPRPPPGPLRPLPRLPRRGGGPGLPPRRGRPGGRGSASGRAPPFARAAPLRGGRRPPPPAAPGGAPSFARDAPDIGEALRRRQRGPEVGRISVLGVYLLLPPPGEEGRGLEPLPLFGVVNELQAVTFPGRGEISCTGMVGPELL